ncbi:MAG TPA: hypothetical protein VNL14_09160 [Candidatus Acidoferrales bacterium]|nr:hypothetical protein [Candidatus Acidoferrales bacterium]
MTFEEIHAWCRANGADARGIVRGREFFIRHGEQRLPDGLPSLGEVFHWDLQVGGNRYPTSPSDMERLVTGKMTLEAFAATR